MSVSVIAGLGNPGPEYQATRHNAGFRVVDALARSRGATWKRETRFQGEAARITLAGRPLTLLKPLTFMNLSGKSVGALCRFFKIPASELVVVFDELQVPLGRAKLTRGGGAGGHNGVVSLIETLGPGFLRYRIGVGPKEPPQMDMKDFVLGKFTPEQDTFFETCLRDRVEELNLLIHRGPALAMNRINQKPDNPQTG